MASISIIIPTYNRAEMLTRTLDSVLAQVYTDWECIVVDDGSTDNTEEVVSSYLVADNRISFHKRPDNFAKGGNGARNYGFGLATGEYINWFDSDDVMLPDFLSLKVDTIGDKQMSFCGYDLVNENLTSISSYFPEPTDEILKGQILWTLKIVTNCVFFRKDFLKNKMLFDEKIKRGQETEFFLRILQGIGRQDVTFIESALFLYVQHSGSISNGMASNGREHIESWLYIYDREWTLFNHDKQILNRLYQNLFKMLLQIKSYGTATHYHSALLLLAKVAEALGALKYRIVVSVLRSKLPKSLSVAYRIKSLLNF